MKKMKNCSICFIGLLFLIAVVSCKNDMEEYDIEKNQRIQELTDIAYTGNYKLSETEVSESLNSFLFGNNDSRNISTTYDIKKIDKITYNTFNCNSRCGTTENYDDIDFYLYQVNNQEEEKQGFAILSDDRRIGEVLAFVDDSEFVEDISDNPFMQLFCTQLESYIDETIEIWDSIENECSSSTSRKSYTDIAKSGNYNYSDWTYNSGNKKNILKTQWFQHNPCNMVIAELTGKNYLVGCGGTALAQILAFNEFPKSCSEKIVNKINQNSKLNFGWNGIYDWKAMKKASSPRFLPKNNQIMIGALLYQAAESLEADYGINKTSTKPDNYTKNIKKLGLSCDNKAAYSFSAIKKSLDNGHPVLISGSAKKEETKIKFLWWSWTIITKYSKGHTWVVDGYANMKCTATNKNNINDTITFTTDYVHCNLGWEGSSDGYYMSKVFNTNQGAMVTDYTVNKISRSASSEDGYYQYNLSIFTNIKTK